MRENDNARAHYNLADTLDELGCNWEATPPWQAYLRHDQFSEWARHAKRRMINPGPLNLIAAKLEKGGEFRLGTDDPVYCRWAMMVMRGRRDFEWLAETKDDFLNRPGGWPETRYEAKALRDVPVLGGLVAELIWQNACTGAASNPTNPSTAKYSTRRASVQNSRSNTWWAEVGVRPSAAT